MKGFFSILVVQNSVMPFKNILLIDDDEEDQEIFLMALDELSCGTQCKAMSNARHALGRLQEGEIKPEVIFLDLNMPHLNGRQFLEIIKQDETLADIPVIIFSTSSDPATIQATKNLGARDFITKPGDFNHLVKLLQSYVC